MQNTESTSSSDLTAASQLLWEPSQAQIDRTIVTDFMRYLATHHQVQLDTYDALYQWSIDNTADFWSIWWDYTGVIGDKGTQIVHRTDDMEHTQWFPDASLNYAENLLRYTQSQADQPALIYQIENQPPTTYTFAELYDAVAKMAAWLRQQGVEKGDRVAGYLPNCPQTVIAMLATTSIGAVWTSTSPDFGTESVVERFGQVTPKVLFITDAYCYNQKIHPMHEKNRALIMQLSEVQSIVEIDVVSDLVDELPYATPYQTLSLSEADKRIVYLWTEIMRTMAPSELVYTPCRFDDPLFILYSSGTTGQPKCIVHCVGGVLLQHLKEHQLHSDLQVGDKLFYFTTCGWMMWNWLVSGLASGASIVLYDGSPLSPDGYVLWEMAEQLQVTHFGTSAKYIDTLKKRAIHPKAQYDLSAMRMICSTGSVLAPESFAFVYEHIHDDICLASISGGTDIVSCFFLGCPILPVYAGESQARGLGMAVQVYDHDGQPVQGEQGELVCTQSFPSQPIYFWGDDGSQYHDAYFADYPGVWCHGDYVILTEHNGIIALGRSDATLNPGGVRIGTAEIYRYVEQLDEIIESIVIGQNWHGDVRVVLFVVLQNGVALDRALKQKIRATIKAHCTPRHLPKKIIQVPEIPRTKSGKIVELAVKNIVEGQPVKNHHALANPEALDYFKNLPALQS